MNFFDAETIKVKAVALLGFSTPAVNLWFKNLEPTLNFLILLGQVAITFLSALYVYHKYRKIKPSSRRKKKDKTP